MERHIHYDIKVIFNLIRHKLNESAKLQYIGEMVTHRQAAVIEIIDNEKDGEIFQKDIEYLLGIRRSTATQMLQEMERQDLIIRESVDNDMRMKKLVLTERAKGIAVYIRDEINEIENTILNGFNEQEQKQLIDFLDRITENLLEHKNRRSKW